MVPLLSDAQDLAIRRAELGIAEAVDQRPQEVAALAARLLRENTLQRIILERAQARIIELEAAAAVRPTLAPVPAARRWRRWVPAWCRALLMGEGLDLG
jgi:hypothetical protein